MRVTTVRKIEKTVIYVQKIIDQTHYMNLTKVKDNNIIIRQNSMSSKKSKNYSEHDSLNCSKEDLKKDISFTSENENANTDEKLDVVKDIQNYLKEKISVKRDSLNKRRNSSFLSTESIL